MDLSSILGPLAPLLAGVNPWVALGVYAVVVVLQRRGVKLPFAPTPAPSPTPANPDVPLPPSSGHPLLDVFLKLILGRLTAPGDLSAAVARMPLTSVLALKGAVDGHVAGIASALVPEPAAPLPGVTPKA